MTRDVWTTLKGNIVSIELWNCHVPVYRGGGSPSTSSVKWHLCTSTWAFECIKKWIMDKFVWDSANIHTPTQPPIFGEYAVVCLRNRWATKQKNWIEEMDTLVVTCDGEEPVVPVCDAAHYNFPITYNDVSVGRSLWKMGNKINSNIEYLRIGTNDSLKSWKRGQKLSLDFSY